MPEEVLRGGSGLGRRRGSPAAFGAASGFPSAKLPVLPTFSRGTWCIRRPESRPHDLSKLRTEPPQDPTAGLGAPAPGQLALTCPRR